MGQQQRQTRTALLAGLALALLAADLYVLTCLIVPLRASQHAGHASVRVAAQPSMDRPPILPTLDIGRQRATRTATPTTTPGFARPLTQAPLAIATPVSESDAKPAGVEAVPVIPAHSSADAGNPIYATYTPSPLSEPEIRPEPTRLLTPVPLTADAFDPTATPTAVRVPPAATDVAPKSTPDIGQLPDSSQLPPSLVPGDAAGFEAYLRYHYSSIAGLPVDIVAVTFDSNESGFPRVRLRITGADGESALLSGAKEKYWLGSQLLEDARLFFSTQSCAMDVVWQIDLADTDSCANAPSCCILGHLNPGNGLWAAEWTYVSGQSIDGSNELECAY